MREIGALLLLFSTVGTVSEDITLRADAQGQCCYLCEADSTSGSCYGCWSLNSICNSPTACSSECDGLWKRGDPPPFVPPAAPQTPLLSVPLVNWNRSYDDLLGPPVVDATNVYLVAGGLSISNETVGWLERLDITTGNPLWNRTVLMNNLNYTDSLVHFSLPPVVADGNVYVQIDNFIYGPSLYAVQLDNGQPKWNISFGERVFPTGVAAGSGGVYFVTYDGILNKSSAENGTVIGGFATGDTGQLTPPMVQGNHVFKSGKSTDPSNAGNFIFALSFDLVLSWPVKVRVDPWMVRVVANTELALVTTTFFDEYKPFPVGQPDGAIIAFDPTHGLPKWKQKLSIAASISQPVLATVEGEAPIAVFTACDTAPIEGMPPVWWVGCTVWAIDTQVASSDIHDSVLWRYALDSSVALSPPKVGNDAVFLGGATFINGTWPYCVWPPTQPLPNCTHTDNFPGFEDPFLLALRVSDGRLLWKTPVYEGKVTSGNMDEVLRSVDDYDTLRDSLSEEGVEELKKNFISAELTKHMMGWPNVLQGVLSFIPWNSFDVNKDGTTLIYTSLSSIVSLDVSARGEPGSASSSDWMAPVAAASCGLATIIIVAVAANKMCESSESEDFLVKRPRRSPPGSGYDSLSRSGYSDSRSPEEDHGYEILKQLGRGGFGHVYLVKKKSNGHLYSLKRIDCRCDRELKIAKREVSILTCLPKHPGLMKIIESFNADNAVFMVLPYYEQGDLANYIQTYPDPIIPEVTVVSFGRQIADVLLHLHKQTPPVVHRDLKPENILMTSDRQRIVVADFGLSRMVDKTYMHTHAGTMAFMAPESFDGPYDTKIDLWSLGCIIYSMCLKRSRNCRVMCVHVGRRGFHQEVADSISARGYSPLVVDLVRQTLQANRHARPSAEEVLFRLGADAPPPLRLGTSHSSLSHSDEQSNELLHAPQSNKHSLNTHTHTGESFDSSAGSVPAPSVHAPSFQTPSIQGGGGGGAPTGPKPPFFPPPAPVQAPPTANVVPPGLLRGIVRSTPDPQSEIASSSDDDSIWCPPSPPPVVAE